MCFEQGISQFALKVYQDFTKTIDSVSTLVKHRRFLNNHSAAQANAGTTPLSSIHYSAYCTARKVSNSVRVFSTGAICQISNLV